MSDDRTTKPKRLASTKGAATAEGKVPGKQRLTEVERDAATSFFKAPASNWPRNAMQRRMQSSGG